MRRAIIAVGLLLVSAIAHAQSANDALQTRFDALIEQGLKDDPISGIAVGIVRHGKLVYARAFGVQKMGEPAQPMTERSLFHMASITKTFVATSVMQLWEQGKVDLDAPVTKYLPYFTIDDPRYAKITVRQMLSHSSGMPDVKDYEWNKPQNDDGALERYVRSLAGMKLKLLFEPGTSFSYSNMAYELLGDLIAKVSGKTFEDYVEGNILKPLGMKDSTLLLSKADPRLLAQGYTRPPGADSASSFRQVAAYPFNRMHSPSSDLMSNIQDMSRWAMANLNHGELDGERILKASTYDLIWKPAIEACRDREREPQKCGRYVGISWFLQGRTISHSGGDDGFATVLILVPDADLALMWMCNTDRPSTVPGKINDEFFKLVKETAAK